MLSIYSHQGICKRQTLASLKIAMYNKVAVILSIAACISAAPQRYNQYQQPGTSRNAVILQQNNEINPDGTFTYSFQSDDGTSAQAQGGVKNAGNPQLEAQTVQGQFSFVAPDGIQYTVQYTADENGFNAYGAHLPTPPPIPAEIQRSLEFNARNPDPESNQPFQPQTFQQPRPVFQQKPFQFRRF